MSGTLSALTRAVDADPWIDPDDVSFESDFDFDLDDPIFELMNDGVLDQDPLDEIGTDDILDIMQAFDIEKREDYDGERGFDTYAEHEGINIPKGRRPERQLVEVELEHSAFRIFAGEQEDDPNVYVEGGDNRVVVGFVNRPCSFSYDIEDHDYYRKANTYAEEVGGKGVNLGFSSFYHSVTIMQLAVNSNGVIEPHEGFDYACDSVSFEVTGQNYRIRSTKADVVLNKYLVNSATCRRLPYHTRYRDLSWAEDSGDLHSFYGTAFDTETTTRSSIVKKIAALVTQTTWQQRKAIAENVVAMASEDVVYESDAVPYSRDFGNTLRLLDRCIAEGTKERAGVRYAPSPFRVLYPQDEPDTLTDEEIRRRQSLHVRTKDYGNSTYHTWPADQDPLPVIMSQNDKYPEYYKRSFVGFQDAMYDDAMKYKSVVHAHIQSALLYKINGKGGCFYDKYNRVGISWYRQRASNLKWHANYYTFSPPGDRREVGSWSYHNSLGVYVSPTFIISRQDIHYATVLPAKFSSLLAACAPLTSPTEHRKNLPKIVSLLGGMSNSTWMTSFRTGSNRFLVCCHISSSGNIPSLIESQLATDNFHRFPDFYILMRMRSYILEQPSTEVTPLFRLPVYLLSLEKDYSQMLQWHIRGDNHATRCMEKVTQAARRHALEEDITNEWMKRQLKFLEKMFDQGATYQEFRDHMRSAPDHPTLNILYFIGLSNLMKDKMETVGACQHAMGFSIWNMITDRHCIEYKGNTSSGVPMLKSAKVVDALCRYLRKYDRLSGAYELIARMSAGPKLPPNYLLNHEKDAKESNREISQMYPQQRIKQNFPEALCETFAGNVSTDMMTDPEKYNTHISDTVDITARGRSLHASEDRSKFCQEQEPQMQALAMGIASVESGSTALRGASAMGLMNKTRIIVYPPKADTDALLDGMAAGDAIVESHSSKDTTKTIRIEKNMTQGLGAIAGGLVNDVYVYGNACIATRIIPGLERGVENATSDDVKRSANVRRGYDFDKVAANFYMAPNRNLKWCMMINNWKKFICSERFSEFNNVAASKHGMIPQSPVFSTLSVQPLLSKSIFGDLVDMFNTARSTLSWGCPPDVVEASYMGLTRAFRQKWLITDSEYDSLVRWGLTAESMDQFISGFWVRDEHAISVIFDAMGEDTRADVLEGRVPLFKMVKRLELDVGRKKRKKRTKHKWIPGLHRANVVAETVYAQRYVAETMMSRHIQPLHPSMRQVVKQRFFSMMSVATPDVDISGLMRLAPNDVTCHVRRARWRDRQPTSIGASSTTEALSLQRIRAWKHLKVCYRDRITDDELKIAELKGREFRQEVAVLERASHYQGQSFKAPAGLPLTRSFDGTIFKKPASFNFTVHLTENAKIERPFTYEGVPVRNFRPMIWGSNALEKVHGRKARLAYGSGMLNNVHVVFYKLMGRNEGTHHIPFGNRLGLVQQVEDRGFTIHYLTRVDASALSVRHHKSVEKPIMAGVVGDDDAIYNYGMYCRSNHAQGFGVYKHMFAQYKSIMPEFVRGHMPCYPKYVREPVDIEQGRITHLWGCQSIRWLRLTHSERPEKVVTVNLNGDRPAKIVPVTAADEVDDDDFWD